MNSTHTDSSSGWFFKQRTPLYIYGSRDQLVRHDLSFFYTYLQTWHDGRSFLPGCVCVCVCLCNLPRNSQHGLQLCTVAGSRHCAAGWCVQHVPHLRLSQYRMKSHQSVAATALNYCLRGAVLYKWIHERAGDFQSNKGVLFRGEIMPICEGRWGE